MNSIKTAGFRESNPGRYRTTFEPVAPETGFPARYGYLLSTPRFKRPCMSYCSTRYKWIVQTLAGMGVNTRCLYYPSKGISKRKCQQIARKLQEHFDKQVACDGEFALDMELLQCDIEFYRHCGGVRIHEWRDICEW